MVTAGQWVDRNGSPISFAGPTKLSFPRGIGMDRRDHQVVTPRPGDTSESIGQRGRGCDLYAADPSMLSALPATGLD